MSSIIFNKDTYDLSVVIASSEDIAAIPDGAYILYNDNIADLAIGNDLFEFAPTLSIEYRDIGNFSVINYFPNGLSMIHLELTHVSSGKTISHDFLIDDIAIISRDLTQTVFRITAKSFYWAKLESIISYSSMKEDESTSSLYPTTIIRQILKQIEYPIKDEKTDEFSMSSDRMIQYVTPNTCGVRQSIQWLLKQSFTPTAGMFFLYWHMSDDIAKILSTKKAYENWQNTSIVGNVFTIPSTFGTSTEILATNDVAFSNPIGGMMSYPIGDTLTLNKYDYVARKWTQDIYDFNRLSNSLPKTTAMAYETSYKKHDKYKIGRFNIDTPNESYATAAEKVRRLMLFSENFQFNTYGSLEREVGQIAAVTADDVLINKRFGGAWMIARQIMRFTRGNFVSSITLVRADRLKNSTDSK